MAYWINSKRSLKNLNTKENINKDNKHLVSDDYYIGRVTYKLEP